MNIKVDKEVSGSYWRKTTIRLAEKAGRLPSIPLQQEHDGTPLSPLQGE